MLIISFRHHFSNLVRCTIVIKKIILKSTFKDNREYFYIKYNLFQDREGTIRGETSLASFHHQLILTFTFFFHLNLSGLKDNLSSFPAFPLRCAETHSLDGTLLNLPSLSPGHCVSFVNIQRIATPFCAWFG